MAPDDFARLLTEALGIPTTQWELWARAWARATPVVVIVPAFGLRAVLAPIRIALALSLALVIAPGLDAAVPEGPWPAVLAAEFLCGLPVALTAAVALWVATMSGGLVDNLRGGRETVQLPNVEMNSTPIGALLSMLVAIAFLQGGGATHVAAALASADAPTLGAAANLARLLAGGIELAVAVAAPVLAVSIIVEVASALIARAASPAFIQPMLAPLRSLALLGVVAVLLDRIAEFIVLHSRPW